MSHPIDPQSLEERVRQALHNRTEEAHVSNDAWAQFQTKLTREDTRRRRRLIIGGGAILAAAAAMVIAITLAGQPDNLVRVETPPIAPAPRPTVSVTSPTVEGTDASSDAPGLPASTGAIQVGTRGDVWLGLSSLEPSANVGSDPVVQISGSPDGASFRYVSAPADGEVCSTVRDFALADGEPRDIAEGSEYAQVAVGSLLVVAQNVDAQGKVSCGTASTRRIALVDPATGNVLSTLALSEPLAGVTGIAVRPDGTELTMSSCEAACMIERVAIDGDELRRVEAFQLSLEVFGVAYRGGTPVIGRTLPDQGGRQVIEDLDGNQLISLEGSGYRALQGDLRGERAVVFREGDVTEIDWRGGGVEPVARRLADPLTSTGERRLPLATGYFYGAMPRSGSDTENAREHRVLDAYERMWVVSCCGEPSHGRSTAGFGFLWNDIEVFLYADRPGGSADPPGPGTFTEQATDTVGTTEVLTYTTEDGPTFSIFSCGGTNYQLWRIDSQSNSVPPDATAALIQALPCTEPLDPDLVAAATVALDEGVGGPAGDLRALGVWWALTDRCAADGGEVGRCYDTSAEIMLEVIDLDPRSITTDNWDGAVRGPDEASYSAAADVLSLVRRSVEFDGRPPIKVACDPSCEDVFG